MRWSGDVPEMLVRMTSNLPLATVNLYSHIAVSTIQAMGHSPFSTPRRPDERALSNGIWNATAATTSSRSSAQAAAALPLSFSTVSANRKKGIGKAARTADRATLTTGS